MSTNRSELYDILEGWSSSKYAVLEFDILRTNEFVGFFGVVSGDEHHWTCHRPVNVPFTGGFYGSAPANDTYLFTRLLLHLYKAIHPTTEVVGFLAGFCNMDPDHDDVEIAGNADFVHHDSGEQFSWDGWTSVLSIADLRHDGDFGIKLKSTDNDIIPFKARGDSVERILSGVTAIYFNNTGTAGTNYLLLKGY